MPLASRVVRQRSHFYLNLTKLPQTCFGALLLRPPVRTKSTMETLPLFDPAPAHRLTQPPDSAWTLGNGLRTGVKGQTQAGDVDANVLQRAWLADAERGWRVFDLDTMDKSYVPFYLIWPRPKHRPGPLVALTPPFHGPTHVRYP